MEGRGGGGRFYSCFVRHLLKQQQKIYIMRWKVKNWGRIFAPLPLTKGGFVLVQCSGSQKVIDSRLLFWRMHHWLWGEGRSCREVLEMTFTLQLVKVNQLWSLFQRFGIATCSFFRKINGHFWGLCIKDVLASVKWHFSRVEQMGGEEGFESIFQMTSFVWKAQRSWVGF